MSGRGDDRISMYSKEELAAFEAAKNERLGLAKTEGVKFDQGKPDLSLVPIGLVEGCARAMMFGVGKYGRDNWRCGFDDSRLLAACLRHIMAYTNGERIDAESGLCHLDCASFSLGVVLDQIRRREMGQKAGMDDLRGTVSA